MSRTLPNFGVIYIPFECNFLLKIQYKHHGMMYYLYGHLVIALQSFDDQYFNYNHLFSFYC